MKLMKLPKYFATKQTKKLAPLHNPFLVYLATPPSSKSQARTQMTESIRSRSLKSSSRRIQKTAHLQLEIAPSTTHVYTPEPIFPVRSMEPDNGALVDAFRIIDRNGDGKISLEDLDLMWRCLGKKLSDKELRLMLDEADKDGDGELNLEEFMNIHREVGQQTNYADEIRVAFNISDVDRNNYISAEELQRVMKRLGKGKTTLAECSAMIKSVDSDGDGQLHFQDFERLMLASIYAY